MKDKSWTDTQDPEFVKVIEDATRAVNSLAMRTFIMAELIDKFYETIVELFSDDQESATSIPENGNVYPSPTQTISEESA